VGDQLERHLNGTAKKNRYEKGPGVHAEGRRRVPGVPLGLAWKEGSGGGTPGRGRENSNRQEIKSLTGTARKSVGKPPG